MLIWLTCASNDTSDVDSTFAGVLLVRTTDVQKVCTHRKKNNLKQIKEKQTNENRG